MNTPNKSFSQAFCEASGIPFERFEDVLIAKTLYPHARLILLPLHKWFGVNCLEAEREILGDAGRACDVAGVADVLSRLPWYYGQRWNLRRELALRLSSRRVLAIAAKVGLAKRRKSPYRKTKGTDPILANAVPGI